MKENLKNESLEDVSGGIIEEYKTKNGEIRYKVVDDRGETELDTDDYDKALHFEKVFHPSEYNASRPNG